jgi:hypothetical protein
MFGALETHVLDEMRGAAGFLGFVNASNVAEDLD